MKFLIIVLCLSLVNGYGIKRNVQEHDLKDPHEHPTMTWEILERFVGNTLYITTPQVLSLPLGAEVRCDDIEGFSCSWPGYKDYAHDHIDFHFNPSNPFYSFVDTFYVSLGDRVDKIYLRVISATSREKMLNVGCHTSFSVNLPIGIQIYHDKDMKLLVEGRHLECAHRVYFVKYCPYHAHGYCFDDKLKVYDLKRIKSRKAFEKVSQHQKSEL
uniref:Non-structural protein 7b n=1 Tax=Canine coronavirus (strain BGF10) TaxID=441619 RepID=NS7B_CVCBG|nr:RecName: Full=Non-structural protein 7b; Short=ns7b; AltName: Full=Accessory protein 7b; Flags: Precursor [Canine coronavirus BGF10]AAQ17227.1 non-structural protein 7b [Canine coronavirus]